MSGPGIPAHTQVDAPVYLQDIMATSLELAGLEVPGHVDFRSFLALAQGEAGSENNWPEGIYGAYMDFQRMISKDGFKLVLYPKVKEVKLFDLVQDPLEMNNLADDIQYRGKVDSLFKDLQQLQVQMRDELKLQAPFRQP